MLSPAEPYKPKPETDFLISKNDFRYGTGDKDENREGTRSICPLAAHIRKTNPRRPGDENHRIVRNGIPYGSEFDEASTDADIGRGLLFACYQSNIDRGFLFIQTQWANKPRFGSAEKTPHPGYDPIIGQQGEGKLEMNLFDKDGKDLDQLGPFDRLVTIKGGEYFFVPSLSALSGILSNTGTSSTTT
jgi:Dyp-type peroxidase family